MSNSWLGARRDSLIDHFITAALVVVAGLIIGAAFWAWNTGWFTSDNAPLTPLIGLAILALVAILINQVSAYLWRAPFKPLTNDKLRETIQGWLVGYKFVVQQHPVEDAGVAFVLTASDSESPGIQIAKNHHDQVIYLSTFFDVPESWHAEFDHLTSASDRGLLDEIRIELAHFELPYTGVSYPLRNVTLTDRIRYDETFSSARLLDKITHVLAAYVALEAVIFRSGHRHLPPSPESNYERTPDTRPPDDDEA